MRNCKIIITGIVQGVGFRPFIFRLASKYNLKGFILNSDEGVYIEVEGQQKIIQEFIKHIIELKPPLSVINKIEYNFDENLKYFKNFEIKKSISTGKHRTLISPDIALCEECLTELFDKNNPRFHYFAINCINCGPRYTIIEDLPYDRKNTSMKHFIMCKKCNQEYNAPLNRRYHSQPNCCPVCGPLLTLYDNSQNKLKYDSPEDLFKRIAYLLNKGEIIAIKGIGGYHLVCNAEQDDVVQKLRERKKRKNKPFAIMSKDIETVKRFCYVNDSEAEFLKSRQRPIVLCRWKDDDKIISKYVAPKLKYLGVMLPYTGLHYLLFQYIKKNLIFTSGNISEEPIVYKDDEVFERLKNIADYCLIYNREIVMNNDDSVLMEFKSKPYLIRRSRGFVPEPVVTINTEKKVLGLGSQLKNTFSLYFENKIIISQHIGDMDNIETFLHFKESLKHFFYLFSFKPDIVAYDLHPEYLTTKFIDELVPKNTKKIGVQHHFAHLVSCLIDNGVQNNEQNFIGVAFDGTGFGEDGNLWGGEFFIFNFKRYERVGHFKYVKMPGGEYAIKEPWRMTISYFYDAPSIFGKKIIDRYEEKDRILELLEKDINAPLTSSVGRLFDAVSAAIGLCKFADYEGEPAVLLENIIPYDYVIPIRYDFLITEDEINDKYIIYISDILEQIGYDIDKGVKNYIISAKFHNTIAYVILNFCQLIREKRKLNEVVLSGGVFQNRYLLNITVNLLKKHRFKVLYHQNIPTNDGGISAGQVAIAANQTD